MTFETIAKLIAAHNDSNPADITPDTTFQSLGVDSLDTVELIMNLEDELDCQIDLDRKVDTVGELAAFVDEKLGK